MTTTMKWGTMFWWDVPHLQFARNLYVGYGSPAACAELASRVYTICMRSHWSAGDAKTPIPGGHTLRHAAIAAGLTGDDLRRLDHAYRAQTERRWAKERAARATAPLDRLAEFRRRYRYGVSYPHTRRVWAWKTSPDAVRAHIEEAYRPGYTTEPYVQIVAQSPLDRLLGRGGRVIAEYKPGRAWLSPLAAAGFISRRVA